MLHDSLISQDVWLTAFWGFDTEEDGSYGFTRQADQERFLSEVSGSPLIAIYGAASQETAAINRNNFIGLLQIDLTPIHGRDRLSKKGWQRRVDLGRTDKWLFAFAVKRAWKPLNRVSVSDLFETYESNAGQFIASYGKLLNPRDKEQLFSMTFRECSVFGETPLSEEQSALQQKLEEFCPSRAFKKSFGTSETTRVDGETFLYVMRLEGKPSSILERGLSVGEIVIKVGISNDTERRKSELNAGFPPASLLRWTPWQSSTFSCAADAEQAEENLIKRLKEKCTPLGGEFFRGNETEILLGFSSVAKPTGDIIRSVR